MLTGTIAIGSPDYSIERARKLLEDLGVKVGPWDATNGEFTDCKADDTAMERLDDFWGPFIWLLTPEGT